MFDTTLVGANPGREVKRKLATLPAAVAVHAMAVGVAMVGQLWAVDRVPEVVPLTPIFVHILPPPGGGGRTTAGGGEHRIRHGARPPLTQPQVIPEQVARNSGPEPTTGEQVVGTENLNPQAEGPEGPGLGPGPETPASEPPVVGPIRLGGDVVPPVPVERPAPRYPEAARRLGIQGVASLEAVIDAEGNVTDVRLTGDPGFGCGQAALEAVRGWRYRPATLNGRRVAVYLTIRVTFQLNGVG